MDMDTMHTCIVSMLRTLWIVVVAWPMGTLYTDFFPFLYFTWTWYDVEPTSRSFRLTCFLRDSNVAYCFNKPLDCNIHTNYTCMHTHLWNFLNFEICEWDLDVLNVEKVWKSLSSLCFVKHIFLFLSRSSNSLKSGNVK